MIIRHSIALSLLLAYAPLAMGQQLPRMHGAFYVPHPIHDVEIDRIAIWLRLSDAQEVAVRRLRDEYEQRWHAHRPEQRVALIASHKRYETEYQQQNPEQRGYNLEELAKDVLALANQFRDALAVHDDEFFKEIEALLTTDQSERLPWVRRWRARDALIRAVGGFTGDGVRLLEFIRPVTSRDRRETAATVPPYVASEPDEYATIRNISEPYETQLIMAMRQLHAMLVDESDLRHRGLDLSRSLHDAGRTEQDAPDGFAELDRLAADYSRQFVVPLRELDRVNDFGLGLLTSVLPDDKAEHLRDIYHTQVAPVVYPDPASAELLYDAAGTMQSLDDGQQQSFDDMRALFASEHPLHCQRMVAAERHRRDMRWMHPRDYQIRAQAWADLAERGFEREALNQQQCTLVAQMLPPDQLAELIIAVWDAEYIRRADLLAARSRRIRDTAPTRIITAWLLRAIPSDAQRQQIMTMIADTTGDDLPDDVAARRRELLTWNFRAIEPKRPWHSQTWLDRHARYEQGIFDEHP